MKDYAYLVFCILAMLFVTAMSFYDDRAPMTEQQQRAAWAQQRTTDNAYRPETLSPSHY